MNFKRENNCPDKKGLSKKVISLITAIVILVAGIGFLTNYYFASQTKIEQLKSENIRLVNENVELTDELARTRFKLDTTKHELKKATFKLGKDMLILPKQSPKFDCDDSTLYMYLYFTNLGYDVRIIAGNLDLDNETFYQCNHIWVWVDGGITGELPYDWGYFADDKEHSYGYVISYRELLNRAMSDQ